MKQIKKGSVHVGQIKNISKKETKSGTMIAVDVAIAATMFGEKREKVTLLRDQLPEFVKEGLAIMLTLDTESDGEDHSFTRESSSGIWTTGIDIGPGGIPIRYPPSGGETPSAPQDGGGTTGQDQQGGGKTQSGGQTDGGGTTSGGGATVEEDSQTPEERARQHADRICHGIAGCADRLMEDWGFPIPDDGGGGHKGGPPQDTGEPGSPEDTGAPTDTGLMALGYQVF